MKFAKILHDLCTPKIAVRLITELQRFFEGRRFLLRFTFGKLRSFFGFRAADIGSEQRKLTTRILQEAQSVPFKCHELPREKLFESCNKKRNLRQKSCSDTEDKIIARVEWREML